MVHQKKKSLVIKVTKKIIKKEAINLIYLLLVFLLHGKRTQLKLYIVICYLKSKNEIQKAVNGLSIQLNKLPTI